MNPLTGVGIPPLPLHDFHSGAGASFLEINGLEAVAAYGPVEQEYQALTTTCALIDLSFRGRICLLGADREKFLHGQVTNEVLKLKTGEGCHAALVNAKGRMQCDLFIYKLNDELLLDFEPGLTQTVSDRLQKYIIAEDVQVVDVAPHYGLLSIQGPMAGRVVEQLGIIPQAPASFLQWSNQTHPEAGDVYVMNHPRTGSAGYDLFIPIQLLEAIAHKIKRALAEVSGSLAGWQALEIARIENAIPRFGMDMTEANLPPETGLQDRLISYAKGCYIGQEIIARIRTYGQVSKALRLLRLPTELQGLPSPGTKLFTAEGKDAGYLTSSALSPKHGGPVGLGYVRKETNSLGTSLHLGESSGGIATIIAIPGQD